MDEKDENLVPNQVKELCLQILEEYEASAIALIGEISPNQDEDLGKLKITIDRYKRLIDEVLKGEV